MSTWYLFFFFFGGGGAGNGSILFANVISRKKVEQTKS